LIAEQPAIQKNVQHRPSRFVERDRVGEIGYPSNGFVLGRSSSRWNDIRMYEVITFEEQRLTGRFCKRVSKTVAKI
jgi:hypothetical protein